MLSCIASRRHMAPSKIDKPEQVAIICCSGSKGKHATSAILMADDCMSNFIFPHIFFFSPYDSKNEQNKKRLNRKGYPMWDCGNTTTAILDVFYKLTDFRLRSWVGIAPEVPKGDTIVKAGTEFLWRQEPRRDFVFTNTPMDDVILHWAFDLLKIPKQVISQTKDEIILYPIGASVISIHDTYK
jgi:hypothetical protein